METSPPLPPLTPAALPTLPPDVRRPSYDRSAVRPGVVHLGVGGFARSHLAVYLDDLLEDGGDPAWGLCGIGVLPGDRAGIAALEEQQGLYTLAVRHPDGRQELRVVGSLVTVLWAPGDPDTAVERLAHPDTRIATLTITEGGYDPPTDPAEDLDRPTSAFGYLAAALRRRRERGLPPFTVLSCDNVQGNGRATRAALSRVAAAADPELGTWIAAEVAFPNSMVDRITPATTPDDVAAVAARLGVRDARPVVCEPFRQWAVDDEFPLGRPELERTDAHLVADCAPYELMKLRLLNAGHQVVGHLGRAAGFELVHEACADERLRGLLLRYLLEEGVPAVDTTGLDVDLAVYCATLVERFGNPAVRDTLVRLCTDASDRIPGFLLPVVRSGLAAGRPVEVAALTVAAWAEVCAASGGAPDPRQSAVTAAARDADPLAFLRLGEVFGDLADQPSFARTFLAARAVLRRSGVPSAADRLAGSRSAASA